MGKSLSADEIRRVALDALDCVIPSYTEEPGEDECIRALATADGIMKLMNLLLVEAEG